MYFYYLLRLVGVQVNWKKRVTQVQLIQFWTVMGHALFNVYYKDMYWPILLSWVEFGLIIQMLVMFGDFYINAYNKKKAAAAAGGGSKDTD